MGYALTSWYKKAAEFSFRRLFYVIFNGLIQQFMLTVQGNFLEKFELLCPNWWFIGCRAPEYLHHAKLLIGNHQNTNMAGRR